MKIKHPSDHSVLLPEYPRTLHLPHKPNTQRGDLVSANPYAADIFKKINVYTEEKVDGSSCAMMLYEDFPIIRNRNHILCKGYNKDTPAKAQFSSVWTYFYKNKDKFQALNNIFGMSVGVYGEWMYALHGVVYDKLPDLFIPFDVFDYEQGHFIETSDARESLKKAGFDIVPLLHTGPIKNYEYLESLCQMISPFASERREGIYIKITDGRKVVKRFKMVREDFRQGCNWSEKSITRNKVKNAEV